MRFGNFSNRSYRIALDTKTQLFWASDKHDSNIKASGVTITEALNKLNEKTDGQVLRYAN
ncbi:hypothetical protein [Pediococcus ethanolidurans]|uniref:DUF1508 domain-containing protein n=1 Tax=Pediococcus ethanolidurans TaxID=319653 RepID=A0A0R2K0B7_9LACO|nr:hypothetical protein [Pediococcus ethanolidurans]KRN83009.1 hypothetical protein IV87_GL001718 [Pediococcus ethanolidurans]MBU7555918.1 hypothetical protein [Pediococcus ethanolidurans]MBU7564213.1 hypothetical protein [Pediococcus ethanolidurans]MCT4398442.1 hypothetical protein [Pediococcus ethanolidurans]MCV3315859.1 hypothetical protein [Pediococcus ethanolidurans]